MISKPIIRKYEGHEVEFFVDEKFTVWIKMIIFSDFVKNEDLKSFTCDDIEPHFWKIETIGNNTITMLSTYGVRDLVMKDFMPNNPFSVWLQRQGSIIKEFFIWLDTVGSEKEKQLWPEDIKLLKDIIADVIGVDSSDFWDKE